MAMKTIALAKRDFQSSEKVPRHLMVKSGLSLLVPVRVSDVNTL